MKNELLFALFGLLLSFVELLFNFYSDCGGSTIRNEYWGGGVLGSDVWSVMKWG